MLALVEQVTYRLRKHDLLAKCVNVQLRTDQFEDVSHQRKLEFETSSTKEIYQKAKELLHELYKNGMFIRLMGVRVDGLCSKEEMQLSLFSKTDNKQEKLDKTIDALKDKYGYQLVTRAGKLNQKDGIKEWNKK